MNTVSEPENIKVKRFLKNKKDQKISLEFFKMVCEQGPYYLFGTLTFREGTGKIRMIKSTNFLIHMMNQRIYGRDYIKRKKSITGFAIVEKHKSRMFDEREHIHFIINSDNNFNLRQHVKIFRKVIRKIVDNRKSRIFRFKSNNLKYYSDKGAITYSMKRVNDMNIAANFKIVTSEGLSDYI